MGIRRIIRKSDVLLLAFFAATAAAFFIGMRLTSSIRGGNRGSASVHVTLDGRELVVLPLSRDTVFTVTPEGIVSGTEEASAAEAFNVVVIEDGFCRVATADCRDRICVKRGNISRNGETIVCLPHRLVIGISGGETTEDAVDTIAR